MQEDVREFGEWGNKVGGEGANVRIRISLQTNGTVWVRLFK